MLTRYSKTAPQDLARAQQLLRATPAHSAQAAQRRQRTDFGDAGSSGLQVRRRGVDHHPVTGNQVDGDYGQYAGRCDSKYTVLLWTILWDLLGYEEFDSLPELKRHWELD